MAVQNHIFPKTQNILKKYGFAPFAIALAHPDEAKTVACKKTTTLWQGKSFPEYGFSKWSWPFELM